jgi:hypothetical protein
MKAALAAKKAQESLTESYQVPALDGRLIQANPLKFALNYRPPTIAVVYTLSNNSKNKKSGKVRKYVHEIKVDFKNATAVGASKPSIKQLEKLCDTLCDKEPTYLNINIISKA